MHLLIIFSLILLASAEDTLEEGGESGNYNTFRRTVCEKEDKRDLFQELDNCFSNESRVVVDAFKECAKKVSPESEGSQVEFMINACQDTSLFATFDACTKEYEANPEYREQMEITSEVKECYNNAFEKYHMESFKYD